MLDGAHKAVVGKQGDGHAGGYGHDLGMADLGIAVAQV